MRKITSIVLSLIMVFTMMMALPANAATIPADGVFVANSTNCSKSSSGTTSFGSGYASVPNGQWIAFNVGITEAGSYKITATQISWNDTAAYKLFVNEMPQGVVSIENTLNAQQTTTVELGTYELLDGENCIQLFSVGAPTGVWIYNITATRVGDLTGDKISVYCGNSTRYSKIGNYDTHVSAPTAGASYKVDVPSDGDYKVYYASANYVAGPSKVNLYSVPNGGEQIQNASDVLLPAHGEWGAYDKAYIGNVSLKSGQNEIKVTLASGVSMRPRSIMIEKTEAAKTATATEMNNFQPYQSLGPTDNGQIVLTVPKKATYEIIADVYTNNGTATQLQLFESVTVDDVTTYPVFATPTIQSGGWTTVENNVSLGYKEFEAGTRSFYINPIGNSVRIYNVRLVEVIEPEIETKLYLGTNIAPNYELTTLRSGTVTVQTTLTSEEQDAVMIAVLYDENGAMKQAVPVTTKVGNTLTGTLDTSAVSSVDASYIKVFVWDSLDTITPLTKVLER